MGFDQFRLMEDTFVGTLDSLGRGHQSRADQHLEALARWWTDGHGRMVGVTPGVVPALICSYLTGEISQAWQNGWQPADLHRVVRKDLTAVHARLVVQAIAEQAEEYRSVRPTLPSWMDQLDALGALAEWGPADDHLARLGQEHGLDRRQLVRAAAELVVLIHHLPRIPSLCPPPPEWGRSAAVAASLGRRRSAGAADVRHLERIRALLAQAESTGFDEEAAAFTAKAQELMTRHAIDAALVEAHAAGRRAGEQPTAVRIGIDDPYAQAKTLLLAAVGNASRCRTVWSKEFGFATVFGFEGDLRSVELLYTSLLVQARSAMARAGDLGPWARNRGFRQSFLVGFASRIGARLEEATAATMSGAEEDLGGAFLPVLAERLQQVDDLRDEICGVLEFVSLAANNRAGLAVGRQAADEAELFRGQHLEEEASA